MFQILKLPSLSWPPGGDSFCCIEVLKLHSLSWPPGGDSFCWIEVYMNDFFVSPYKDDSLLIHSHIRWRFFWQAQINSISRPSFPSQRDARTHRHVTLTLCCQSITDIIIFSWLFSLVTNNRGWIRVSIIFSTEHVYSLKPRGGDRRRSWRHNQ